MALLLTTAHRGHQGAQQRHTKASTPATGEEEEKQDCREIRPHFDDRKMEGRLG